MRHPIEIEAQIKHIYNSSLKLNPELIRDKTVMESNIKRLEEYVSKMNAFTIDKKQLYYDLLIELTQEYIAHLHVLLNNQNIEQNNFSEYSNGETNYEIMLSLFYLT